jgi:threonine dehydratase
MSSHAFLPSLSELEQAANIVYRTIAPTPQYVWPLLAERLGTEVWTKHENHTVTGAFKVRGGLVYFHRLIEARSDIGGVISATRGNHGQSVGFAARKYGLSATIVVPHGNSVEKNAAMRALGVNLVEHGSDFQEALEFAQRIAAEKNLHMVPSFHRDLVLGVASYCIEFLRAVPDLELIYVPIGLGSGASAMIAAREALRHGAEIVGVVSDHAPAYALSFAAHRKIEHAASTRLADGVACRTPDEEALAYLWYGLQRVIRVSDTEVAQAMKYFFVYTHNTVEGAGAAPLAAALKERALLRSRKVGLVITGGNVDHATFARVLLE